MRQLISDHALLTGLCKMNTNPHTHTHTHPLVSLVPVPKGQWIGKARTWQHWVGGTWLDESPGVSMAVSLLRRTPPSGVPGAATHVWASPLPPSPPQPSLSLAPLPLAGDHSCYFLGEAEVTGRDLGHQLLCDEQAAPSLLPISPSKEPAPRPGPISLYSLSPTFIPGLVLASFPTSPSPHSTA